MVFTNAVDWSEKDKLDMIYMMMVYERPRETIEKNYHDPKFLPKYNWNFNKVFNESRKVSFSSVLRTLLLFVIKQDSSLVKTFCKHWNWIYQDLPEDI